MTGWLVASPFIFAFNFSYIHHMNFIRWIASVVAFLVITVIISVLAISRLRQEIVIWPIQIFHTVVGLSIYIGAFIASYIPKKSVRITRPKIFRVYTLISIGLFTIWCWPSFQEGHAFDRFVLVFGIFAIGSFFVEKKFYW